MTSAIIVHPRTEASWSFAADYAHRQWSAAGGVEFHRLTNTDKRPVSEILRDPSEVTRLIAWGVPFTAPCLDAMPALREVVCEPWGSDAAAQAATEAKIAERGVKRYAPQSEGFWGQSVSEFGLALTLCALRRIPQLHHQIITDLSPWDYNPPGGIGQPGQRAHQFGDDPRFASGTVEGKRIRIVGAGNIASRYASFVRMLGADVAAWDPFASEPCFHRAGSRRERFLDRLVQDADIFVPMVPLTPQTTGLVSAAHLNALPKGCLVVCVTRMQIMDTATLRRRVLADELSLAADVFDIEPLPLTDPLLGRSNVIHTPHNAGRTRQANEQWAEAVLSQFVPTE